MRMLWRRRFACKDNVVIRVAKELYLGRKNGCSTLSIRDKLWKLDSNTTSATWELSSLVYKVTRIYRKLRKQVDKCHLQIEDKLHRKLLDLFQKDTHLDNQKVLSTLFSLKDDKPLKDCCSQEKIGVPDLLNKVVVLLISKPEILPLEELLFLVQQTCSNFPGNDKTMRRYEIVWVPIPSSSTWTVEENKVFKHLSDILPWCTIRQPSQVSSAVVNYLKHMSGFAGEPVMVVVDQNGRLANLNAIHMVYIWGPMAYPFTASREEKLWEEVNWFGQLIADEIDPLLSKQIEEGRICLYGSSDINWIRELSTRIKEVTETGLQLDLIYVGKRRLNDDQYVSNIISTIAQEKLSSYLAYPKMHFFWLRMEHIKRSKFKRGKNATRAEHILKNVGSLVNFDDCEKSWALFGEGFSKDILQLQGRKLMECLRLFQVWGENIGKAGFMAAIRCALEPPTASLEHCYISNVSQFVQRNHKDEGIVLCEECKRPMEMFTVYQCNAVE
ncbi:hypothetical protein MKX01_027728 [Papaver californicum]|nr:hypothetical protein MKX01_027728 [Papaver californicum]